MSFRQAFAALGYDLDGSSAVHELVIDNLHGTELTAALQVYVRRMNFNPDDRELQVGSGKYLDEAAARNFLKQRTGSYSVDGHAGNFPIPLANAFTALGLALPPSVSLDKDPHRQVQQCLFLLAVAVNRLRNDAGAGHGRPSEEPEKDSSANTAGSSFGDPGYDTHHRCARRRTLEREI